MRRREGSLRAWSTEIAAFARAAADRLGLEVAEVLVGGGLMRSADDALIAEIAAALPPGLTVQRTSAPPIVGAALLALDELGAPPDAQARAREQLVGAVRQVERAGVR